MTKKMRCAEVIVFFAVAFLGNARSQGQSPPAQASFVEVDGEPLCLFFV
jgi:hypothetical protein